MQRQLTLGLGTMATVEARDWLADIEGAKRLLKPQLAPEDWTDEVSGFYPPAQDPSPHVSKRTRRTRFF